MLVSIITVCFNSEKHIEQTILSVIAQTYTSIEHIIIDGQSKDGTLTIIGKYARQYPDRIKFISEPDTGIYNAMNKGVKLAAGELIGIINSDDWYEQTAVEAVVGAYKEKGPAVYHGIQRTHRDDVVVGLQCTYASQLTRQMIEHPTCFLPKSLYVNFGFFNESYRYVGDYELMLRLQHKGVSFNVLEQIVANFREGGASHKIEAVWENYRLWRTMNLLSKREYWYRLTMDRFKLAIGRGNSGK